MSSLQPVIFKRKSKQQSGSRRQRDTSPGDSSTNNDGDSDSPSTLASKLKKRNKSGARLSFGATDHDSEVSCVPSSSYKHSPSTGRFFPDKEVKFKPGDVPVSAKIACLRLFPIPSFQLIGKPRIANISTPLPSPTAGPKYDAAYLKELKANTPSVVMMQRQSELQSSDPYDADMSLDISDASVVGFQDDSTDQALPEALIPSSTSIKSAREARERMRKSGAPLEQDFISLSVTRIEDVYKGPHPESRLMREEDDLGDGDDEYAEFTSSQERIALGKKSRVIEAERRKAAMVESIADADEEDEEAREWELEQIRRGALQTPERSSRSSKPKPVYKAAPIPPPTPVPILSSALARVSQQLAQLSSSHAQNTATLNSLAQQRDEIDSREKELREMVQRAEDKRAYFASFQEWIQGVASFLDDKYPRLEALEQDHILYLQRKREIISTRRLRDDEDDLLAIYGSLPESLNTEDVEQRRAQRAHRHSRRQARMRTKPSLDEEGYSTDSSLPADDESAYREAVTSIRVGAQDVLADVRAEEFKDPSKGRWDSWRKTYTDLYVNAWGGLGVVSVWEFWARLELAGLDFIEDSKRSLDSFKWFVGLYEYSRPDGEDTLGPDGDLVASLIMTAVLPRLCLILEAGALDVYSLDHIKRMVDLADEVEANIEEGTPKFQTLLKSAYNCFEREINLTEQLVAKYTTAQAIPLFNPAAVPCRQRFLARRVKLLQNLLLWQKRGGETFGLGALATTMVDRCVLPIAEGGWTVGGEVLVREVAALLPLELRSQSLKARLNIV